MSDIQNFQKEAIEKLDKGEQTKFSDRKEQAMKRAVHDALCEFCRQDYEFAQAVVQGGSFADCMKAVAKGVGGSISDLEAYRRAVRFYFPGSDVVFQMKIALCEADKEEANAASKATDGDPIILDLADFL